MVYNNCVVHKVNTIQLPSTNTFFLFLHFGKALIGSKNGFAFSLFAFQEKLQDFFILKVKVSKYYKRISTSITFTVPYYYIEVESLCRPSVKGNQRCGVIRKDIQQ